MRVLFTFAGGSGHYQPLVPLARAAVQRGHEVAFACQSGILASVQADSFTAFDTGGNTLLHASSRAALVELDADREDRAIRNTFAGRVARERATALLDLCRDWQPDLVVRDELDFGSALAAERLGLPHASVLVIAAGALVRHALVAEPLNALRAELSLDQDPELRMLSRYLVLSPFPPSFRDPAFPLPPTAFSLRPAAADGVTRGTVVDALSQAGAPSQGDPPSQAGTAEKLPPPSIYFTLGTIFNLESGDLFERVLEGLSRLSASVFVTVGRDLDPDQFGGLPAHVHVERYLPQSQVLPRCSLVVSHAGSGSVMGALAHGLPQVLLPMGADQPHNAARCQQLGVARVLDALRATPTQIRDAASAVLADRAYRVVAQRLQQEIDALPSAAETIPLLEKLAATREL
jgi:UDP:flavonoid glycosyltransferase YjiC (YdhE family)